MMRRLAAGVLIMFLASCAAAPDETWFRIIEVRDSTGTASVAVIPVELRDETSHTVDLVLQNTTAIVGSSGSQGVGIEVFVARIEYRAAGRDLPPSEFPLAFFLPAPGTGSTNSQTLQDLPVAPVVLKSWLRNPANFPPELLGDPLIVETRIILRGRTDEGRNLETDVTVALEFR